ncbi:unnamed protein product [Urochloa humidicola]
MFVAPRFKSMTSIISGDNSLVLLSGFTSFQNSRCHLRITIAVLVLIYVLDIAHTYLLVQTPTHPPSHQGETCSLYGENNDGCLSVHKTSSLSRVVMTWLPTYISLNQNW